jgi:hypothetical protein
MSDDSLQSEPNRGLRVLEAVRRRLKRVEIETHLIRADLAHLEAGHELEIAEELESELGGDAVDVLLIAPSGATESEPAAVTGEVVRVDLLPKVQRGRRRKPWPLISRECRRFCLTDFAVGFARLDIERRGTCRSAFGVRVTDLRDFC